MAKVIIGCEFSGEIRKAFTALGHDAWSCDRLPSDTPGQHYQCDLFDKNGRWHLPRDFDLGIFHPPCTHTAVSGARWFPGKQREQAMAVEFFINCYNAPVKRCAVEHPVSILSTCFRKPDQIIQPWQFGHGEVKATCLWLRNLPFLSPSRIVDGRESRIWRLGPGANRWKERSRTLQGIAQAMADQWGKLLYQKIAS